MSLYILGFNIAIFIIFNMLKLPVLPAENLVLSASSLYQPLSFILNNYSHANFMHLLFNMVILYQYGSIADSVYNKNQQATIYLFSGLAISAIMFLYISFLAPTMSILGFSGIACFILGAVYIHLDKMNARNLLIFMGIYHIIVIALNMGIAWEAHLVGGVLGYLYSISITKLNNMKKNPKKKKIKHNFKIIK